MKYKVLTSVLILIVIVISLLLSHHDYGLLYRTHQHLEYNEKAEAENSADAFSTHLPIIMIDMGGSEPEVFPVSYENGLQDYLSTSVNGTVEVIDNEEKYNLLSDQPSLQVAANVSIRGNSSKLYNKSNYKLSFINADGTENKENGLLGMESHDEWALHGPYVDRTLIRNYMCMNVAGQIMPYTPDVRFCELFVNGEYRGVYLAMETVARGEGRVDIKPYNDRQPCSSYILQANWYSDNANNIEPFSAYTKMMRYVTAMSVEYPSENITPECKENIEQEISAYEKALYSFDYDDEAYGYRAFFDIDSFIDYAIINEFFQNYDAGNLSTYFYKDIGDQRLHIGPVWDFNNACDNFKDPLPEFSVIFSVRYNMLMKDEYFVERLIDRYHQLRKTVLSEAYLMNYVDETVAYLGPAVDRNFTVWNDTFDEEKMQSEIVLNDPWRNPESYAEAVEQLKTHIQKRGSYLDEHIDTLRQFCSESATKKYNH